MSIPFLKRDTNTTIRRTRFTLSTKLIRSVPNISIDYGIMEKADNVYVLCSDFGWSDLGTWGSLHENHRVDENQNAVWGNKVLLYETRNSIINMQEGKTAVVQGLDGYIVVETDNTLLICKKDDEQQIPSVCCRCESGRGEKITRRKTT